MLKGALRAITPPIVWGAARSLGSRLRPGEHRTFRGPHASWDDAVRQSDGWSSDVVTQKALTAALAVRDGRAAWEQDGVVEEHVSHSSAILSLLVLASGDRKDRLDIVDFGGSFGTHYFQNRRFLDASGTPYTWHVVDLPNVVALGREHLATPALQFHADLREATSSHPPQAVLFSGSFQYLADPWPVVDQIQETGARHMALDRVLVSPNPRDEVFVQHPDPNRYYPATYPVRCFGVDALVERFSQRGWRLVERFSNDRHRAFDHSGFLFTRR